MAVSLKNLAARSPRKEDLATICEMLASHEPDELGMAKSLREDLLSNWHQADFSPSADAWIISTNRGEIAGFACIGHKDHTCISTCVWVHPRYRRRGIGTLLLRLVEMRACEHIPLAPPAACVVLQSLLFAENVAAQSLFEREEYHLGRSFLRLTFTPAEDAGVASGSNAAQRSSIDIGLEHNCSFDILSLFKQRGMCSGQIYKTYEKELRPAVQAESKSERASREWSRELVLI